MRVKDKLEVPADIVYYNDSYLLHILQNMHRVPTDTITLTETEAYRYQGDFFKLLRNKEVPASLWLLTTYLNGMSSPIEYDGYTTHIKVIRDTMLIDKVISLS
jgi:hypothetical protein